MPHVCPLRQFHGHPTRCTAVFRHASRGLQQAAFLRMCARKKRHRALSLSGGDAARALAARASCAALVEVDLCRFCEAAAPAIGLYCSGQGRGARRQPWPFAWPACAVRERAATARALCGEEAQHACLQRARAAPRGLQWTLRLKKAAALTTGLSCSVQGPGATRRPRLQARQTFACAQESGHRERSLWEGGAARALAARARDAARD